jgi:hypothetical protein
MGLPLRYLELDERLSNHRRIAVALDVPAADVKITLLGNSPDLVSRVGDGRDEARTEKKDARQRHGARRVAGKPLPPTMAFPHISLPH